MTHRVSVQAEADLNDIWYYIANESSGLEIADRLIDSITDRFYLLACRPHIGRPRDKDLRPGLRSFPVAKLSSFTASKRQPCLFFAYSTQAVT